MPIRDVRLQAAILRDRRLLIVHCRLPDGQAFWLLPGGGARVGQAPEAALAREVREELGVEVAVCAVLSDVGAEPPDGTYQRWRTYRCVLTRGDPVAQGADGIATLDAVAWLPLDDEAAWPEEVREDRFLAPQLRRVRNGVGEPAGAQGRTAAPASPGDYAPGDHADRSVFAPAWYAWYRPTRRGPSCSRPSAPDCWPRLAHWWSRSSMWAARRCRASRPSPSSI